jgi:hypothetical protein
MKLRSSLPYYAFCSGYILLLLLNLETDKGQTVDISLPFLC